MSVGSIKMAVAALAVATLWSCEFHSSSLAGKKVSTKKPAAQADSGSAHAGDGAADGANTQTGNTRDAAPAMEASTSGDASRLIDAGQPGALGGRDDGGLGDSGAFGNHPVPTDPMMKPQNGGLQCNGAFCPFTADPIKPCCTTEADVTGGAARDADRCGLDFSLIGSDFYGTQCWQRDQPGVVDSTCPNVSVDIHTQEPGCCSDQGRCGGVNTDHALGCHYDPSQPQEACGGSPGPDGGTGSTCELRGVYALRVTVDLDWGGRSGGLVGLTDDGRGPQVLHLLANIESIDPSTLALHGSLRPCGVQLPSFYSTTLCEAYEPIFPTAMWESSAMPRFPLTGHLQCLGPGCIMSLDAQTFVLGIELANPEAPWPTADETPKLSCPDGSGATCFPDQDGDKLPGLTVQVATSGIATGGTGCSGRYTKTGAPLSASIAAIFGGVRRTDRVELGVRMKLGGSAKLDDTCHAGNGSGIAEFVNSRAWQCLVQQGTYNYPYAFTAAGANDACTSQEAAFMDANLPIYNVLAVGKPPDSSLKLADTSVSKGPLVSLVRLGDPGASASCADVRNAAFP